MITIEVQAMHPQHSDGQWINIPHDMGKHYQSLPGWKVRELVDRADAESLVISVGNGIGAALADA